MPELSPNHNQLEYTVSEASNAIKRVVEDAFGYIRLRGEISGYRGPHSSGHCYFTLKDDQAAINAVMWRGSFQKMPFKPEDGLEVVAVGRITTYPGKSNYQIIVERMEPAGVGALMALLEARKKKLEAEGLFSPARKKKLPFLPEVIGVVTSPTGAIIRDILHRVQDRFPTRIIVWPVAVQGEGAAEQIAAAIHGFNVGGDFPKPDLLIVARGGGSIEDLWPFNEEIVVRAAAESAIPLISAVGHETDTTLIDYVSDLRAPTPTAAAELALPVREEWRLTMMNYGERIQRGLMRWLSIRSDMLASQARMLMRLPAIVEQGAQKLDSISDRLLQALPKMLLMKQKELERFRLHPTTLLNVLKHHAQDIARLSEQLQSSLQRQLKDAMRRVAEQARMLESLNYERILERGFALVRDSKSGELVTSASTIKPSQELEIQLKDGRRTVKAS